jgi:hypothetical protein
MEHKITDPVPLEINDKEVQKIVRCKNCNKSYRCDYGDFCIRYHHELSHCVQKSFDKNNTGYRNLMGMSQENYDSVDKNTSKSSNS